jgi:hypothetical protein
MDSLDLSGYGDTLVRGAGNQSGPVGRDAKPVRSMAGNEETQEKSRTACRRCIIRFSIDSTQKPARRDNNETFSYPQNFGQHGRRAQKRLRRCVPDSPFGATRVCPSPSDSLPSH